MPKVSLNKKKVMSYLGKGMDGPKLADRISMLGTDLERVTNDEIIVEIFPNRPDMLSEEGFARALSSFVGARAGLREYKVRASDYESHLDKEAIDVRPFAANAVVKGIKMGDYGVKSLMNMQEKLHGTQCRDRKKASIGVYDLDAIQFPLRYLAVDSGFAFRPLFSERRMTVREILEEHPKGREYAHLLPGPKYTVWMDAKDRVLSLPPIINSAETAVTEKTRNLFVDVTGTHLRTVQQALNIVVAQLADMGGEIWEVKVNGISYPNMKPTRMRLKIGYANKLLGLEMDGKGLCRLLERMGHGAGLEGDAVAVDVPAYRADVLHPMDLAEDAAIAHGYENFEPYIPEVSTIGEESPLEIHMRKTAEICSGFGFLECYNYHLTSEKEQFARMERGGDYMKRPGAQFMRIINSSSESCNIVRNALLPGLMKVLSENKHHEYPQNLFEVGRAIFPDKSAENGAFEAPSLAVVMCSSGADFSSIKSVAESIARECGKKMEFREGKDPSFMEGRCATIVVGKRAVGTMGEISPKVLNNYGLELPVAALEMGVDSLMS